MVPGVVEVMVTSWISLFARLSGLQLPMLLSTWMKPPLDARYDMDRPKLPVLASRTSGFQISDTEKSIPSKWTRRVWVGNCCWPTLSSPDNLWKADCAYCFTASLRMLTLQTLSSSLNAGTAKKGCLGWGKAFGWPPAACLLKRPRPFTHYRKRQTYRELTLIFFSLQFWKTARKNTPKRQGFLLPAEPLKSLGKKGKTLKIARNSLKRKKARKTKKGKEKKIRVDVLNRGSRFAMIRIATGPQRLKKLKKSSTIRIARPTNRFNRC